MPWRWRRKRSILCGSKLRLAILTHSLVLLLCLTLALGALGKTLQDWNNLSPILGVPVGLMYAAALPTSVFIALLEVRHLYRLVTNTHSTQKPQQGA